MADARDLDGPAAGSHKLPVEHVAALLVEAVRLHGEALHLLEIGATASAARMLTDARMLAGDAASYTLPSGLRLSAQATISTLDGHIRMVAAAFPR